MARDVRLVEMAIGQRANFHDFAFLERSGPTEVTLSGTWPAQLHAPWAAEVRRVGWRLVDNSKSVE